MRRFLLSKVLILLSLVVGLLFLIFLRSGTQNSYLEPSPANNLPNTEPTNIPVEVTSLRSANAQESQQIDMITAREQWEKDRIPPEFKNVDFKNFTYSSVFGLGQLKLMGGVFERDIRPKGSVIPNGWTARFLSVEYRDFTHSGQNQALVELVEVVSAGSSTSSFVYKMFGIRNGRPVVIWQISTGSESNCGLKQFSFQGDAIVLDVFGTCTKPHGSSKELTSDIYAERFTRFKYIWGGRTFKQNSSEVFPFPEREVHGSYGQETLKDILDLRFSESR